MRILFDFTLFRLLGANRGRTENGDSDSPSCEATDTSRPTGKETRNLRAAQLQQLPLRERSFELRTGARDNPSTTVNGSYLHWRRGYRVPLWRTAG